MLCSGEGLSLTKEQKGDFNLEDTIKELNKYANGTTMSEEEFKAAHKRLQEISSRVKQITGSLTADQQKKYEKKQERKLNKVTTNNRERL